MVFIKKLSSYFLLFLFLCLFSFIRVNSYKLPLKGIIIYIDPGHGGVDSGSSYKDILEKELNLEISYELMYELENKGAKVYMTRYDDYDLSSIGVSRRKKSDLSSRVKLINESDADIYLSIHLNSSNSSKWSGVQIFYDDINDKNKLLANNIQKKFDSKRKISEINGKYMYDKINKTGVLIELGFLSNAHDRSELLDTKRREILLNNITNGIIDYFEL